MTPSWRTHAIRWVTILVVLGVAAIAAIVSFSHMVDLGTRLGESWRARLIPLSVDGLIVAASMVLIDRRMRGLRPSTLAWGAVVAGVVTSLIANAAHATTLGAMLWSAWPAVAFAGAFELLLQLFRSQDPARTEPVVVPVEPAAPVDLPAARYQAPEHTAAPSTPSSTPLPAGLPPSAQSRVPAPAAPQPASTYPVVAPTPTREVTARPTPEQRRTTSVVVPISPIRSTGSQTSQSAPLANELTPTVLAAVRSELSRNPLGRRELAKRLSLTEHIARRALEHVAKEQSDADSTQGARSRKTRGGAQ